MTPSPYIQRLRAQDRALAWIVAAAFTPLVVFVGVGLAAMLGSPPSHNAVDALAPVLFWSFLSMFALLVAFRAYCWIRS